MKGATPPKLGAHAEQLACAKLKQKGLDLVTRNYHCRYGEIDLIMRDGPTLVFIEVRQRRSSAYGGAAASIDQIKLSKLVRSAQHYLGTHYADQLPLCRFDVVALEGDRMHWLTNIDIDQQIGPSG